MTTYVDVGAYEAKTHFTELLRKARGGMAFRITNRGEHFADLVPPGTAEKRRGVEAARQMQQFVRSQPAIQPVDIRALIEDGRD